jgi:hypothetical protein
VILSRRVQIAELSRIDGPSTCGRWGATQLSSSNPNEAQRVDLALPTDEDRPRRGRWFLIGFLPSAVHFVYATLIGFVIDLRLDSCLWVSIAWLPGSLLLDRFGSLVDGSPLMAVGFYLLIGGSILAGITATKAIRGLVPDEGHRGYDGRFWLALLLWIVWVPVPFRGTIFYWFEAY